MVFSSPIFLFLFLPVVLGAYYSLPGKSKNFVLLLTSLVFYAWGEGRHVLLLLASISMNFGAGLLIDYSRNRSRQWALALAVAVNLGLIVFFKYWDFLLANWNVLAVSAGWQAITIPGIHLPLGISFFTFQAISYQVDVYRRVSAPQKNPLDLALYIALFPQLIAGPIVRYHDVDREIRSRRHTLDDFSSGIRRFIIGLSKKMLIANPLAVAADMTFSAPADELSASVAWLGLAAYTLQIYFDFSGYSDMAIGLGRMFGFHFLENFNLPYISSSIREFWRRWHISLSTWFRDYLYIPMGGSRVGSSRLSFNLLLVFFLCGLWHGASWNFVIWGLLHGLFLALERIKQFRAILDRMPMILTHTYTLIVIIVAWVFFRADTLPQAVDYLKALIGNHGPGSGLLNPALVMSHQGWLALTLGVLFSGPLQLFVARIGKLSRLRLISDPALLAVFLASIVQMSSGTYNPFIYFRF